MESSIAQRVDFLVKLDFSLLAAVCVVDQNSHQILIKWLCKHCLVRVDSLVKVDPVLRAAVHPVDQAPGDLIESWAAEC